MLRLENLTERLAQEQKQCTRPGARFSKAPQPFRASKAILSKSVPKNIAVYTPEKSCM